MAAPGMSCAHHLPQLAVGQGGIAASESPYVWEAASQVAGTWLYWSWPGSCHTVKHSPLGLPGTDCPLQASSCLSPGGKYYTSTHPCCIFKCDLTLECLPWQLQGHVPAESPGLGRSGSFVCGLGRRLSLHCRNSPLEKHDMSSVPARASG